MSLTPVPTSSATTGSAEKNVTEPSGKTNEATPGRAGDELITINVGGQEFTTFVSTLTSESTYFTSLFSKDWNSSSAHIPRLRGMVFIDANAKLFEHLLLYFQRLSFPLFWTRESGYDYALYAALRNEAAFFGVDELEQWIAEQKYLQLVTIENWFEYATFDVLRDSLNPLGGISSLATHSDDTVATFSPDKSPRWLHNEFYMNLTKKRFRFSG